MPGAPSGSALSRDVFRSKAPQLTSVVFLRHPRAQAVARRLEAGRVAINGMQHDPLARFGGYKQSGVGREFGVFGLESFLEAKTIVTA